MREVAEEIGVSPGIVSRHLGRAVDQVDASGS
ncbi:hypothetical protein [Roseovarius sp. A-2]